MPIRNSSDKTIPRTTNVHHFRLYPSVKCDGTILRAIAGKLQVQIGFQKSIRSSALLLFPNCVRVWMQVIASSIRKRTALVLIQRCWIPSSCFMLLLCALANRIASQFSKRLFTIRWHRLTKMTSSNYNRNFSILSIWFFCLPIRFRRRAHQKCIPNQLSLEVNPEKCLRMSEKTLRSNCNGKFN